MKYFLLPLGCQMNQSDTERVKTVLQGMGFTPTDNEDEATILPWQYAQSPEHTLH